MDGYIEIERTSTHVHLQVLKGDITNEKTEAVVVFRSNVDNAAANGDSQRLLRVAGRKVGAEYQQVKSQGGRSVTRGVVHTGAGNLDHPEHIFHFHIEGDNRVKFRETLMTTFRLADREGIKSLAFPGLLYHDYSPEGFAKTMVEAISDFTRNDLPVCLHFIQIVITDDRVPVMPVDQATQMERLIARQLRECTHCINNETLKIRSRPCIII